MAKKAKLSTAQPGLYTSKVPQMPEGYYHGDKPNPNLRAFVEAHMRERPYAPATDDYSVPAFDHPIETTKATAVYNMHTYWSKKPHDAVQQYICHYTHASDLVLDPFCGSGGTALAAIMEGRSAVAIDRSPAATFITRNYCTPVDPFELQTAFDELERKIERDIDWLYETRCDRCGGKATTAYTVYSQVYACPHCMNRVPLSDCIVKELPLGTRGGGKAGKQTLCPFCIKKGIEEPIFPRGDEKLGAMPVLVRYECQGGCKPARSERRYNDVDSRKREYFERFDLGKLSEIEKLQIPYWYPSIPFPRGDRYHRDGLKYNGIDTVADLFTKRSLWALASIRRAIMDFDDERIRQALLFAVTGIILNCSRMYREREEGRGTAKGNYYIPQLSREMVVTNGLRYKLEQQLLPGYAELLNLDVAPELCISTQSACKMDAIPADSIDYIFTDPPYASTVQYGELNFVWEAWLGFDTQWLDEEIVVNEPRHKTVQDWADLMRQAMAESFRVLKPGRWVSLCYHDTSEGTWALVQDIMAEVGFVPDQSQSVLFIDAEQKSYNQLTADKVNKRDLVINFRKPQLGEISSQILISGDEDETTFSEKVRTLIYDYLSAHPGSSKDRVYDQVVSRMVRAGQMEAHDFDEILEQVAEPVRESMMKNLFEPEAPNLFGTHESVRWYLRETETSLADAAESAKEDAAAERVAAFIANKLEDDPDLEGVHFSDLWEQYVYTVKDKPRRHLRDWLSDYFYQTADRTYRLPASEEESRLKAEGRQKGTSRLIKRYLTYLEQGTSVPDRERPSDATLAEWIRHCKRSGMYEQGKLLYEKGGLNVDTLPEEAMVNVEEDYQVCVRTLARAGAGAGEGKKAKGGRGRTQMELGV